MPRTQWERIVNLEDYYTALLKDYRISGTQITGRCPMHDDSNASFSASLVKPVWTCHAKCGKGDIVGLHAKVKGITRKQAERALRNGIPCDGPVTDQAGVEGIRTPEGDRQAEGPGYVPQTEVTLKHKLLLSNKEALKHLQSDRGISLKSINKYQLGFDGTRIWIPIYEDGKCVNVKKHLFKGPGPKSLGYHPGMSRARIYPEVPVGNRLFITEGEFKAILLNQLGFPAITGTAGAKNWDAAWDAEAEGKDVYIVFDIDTAGRTAAVKLATHLIGVAATVRVIELPICEPSNADFPDYIIRHGYTALDFQRLCDGTPIFTPKGKLAPVDVETPPVEITLGRAADAEHHYKRVKLQVTVAGKDTTPYQAPKRLEVACDMSAGELCLKCPLAQNIKQPGLLEAEFDPNSSDVLKMIRCNDEQQSKFIRKKFGLLSGCKAWTMKTPEIWKVEELSLIPEITFSDTGNPYVVRKAFSLIGGDIKSNQSYSLTALSIPDPESQYATLIVTDAVPVKTSIEAFKVTKELQKDLRVFQVGKSGVNEAILRLTEDLTHTTQIWGREDIIQAVMLTLCSPRRFSFAGQLLEKGWLEALIIGDTRTGKSETVRRIMRRIQLGEFITGENLSKAGLIGGLQANGSGKWHLTWGALPLNNGGFVCIDETQGLPEEVIGDLSGIRSSGVAEITKIVKERTDSQVRILWISNPRKGRYSGFAYGVHAIREVFGKPEDIARLDFAISAAEGEVPLEVINSFHDKREPKFTSDQLRNLVLFAWSRKPEHIRFTREATQVCMDAASRMSKVYSSEIPLAEPAEQRIKIARVAASVACLTYSSKDGEHIDVLPTHALWAEKFLTDCYSKPSMGYDLFSAQALKGSECSEAERELITREFTAFRAWDRLRDAFLENPHGVRQKFLAAKTGMPREELDTFLDWLGRHDLFNDTPVGYKPTAKFASILRGLLVKGAKP